MATTVTKIIDPDNGSGTDYTSLSAWEAAQQGDLTGVRDEIAVAKCRCTGGTADTTAATIDGWTTSSTQYIKIWTDTAESYRHAGSYPSGNKYRLESTDLLVISIGEPYTRVEGLSLKFTGTPGATVCLRIANVNATDGSRILSCVIDGNSNATTGMWLDDEWIVANNLVLNCSGEGIIRKDSSTATVYNNTVRNCGTGFLGHWTAGVLLKNNIADGCTTCYSGDFSASSSNNAASDTTAPGSSSVNSITITFASTTSAILTGSGNAEVIGAAANLYNDATYAFQTDIVGTDRGGSGASWDIGAYETAESSSTPSLGMNLGLFMGMFRGMRGSAK